VILGAALAPVGRVRPGQLAAVLGPDAATVDDHVQLPGGGFGTGHAQQHGMDPRQHGGVAPFAQPAAQGRAGRATIAGGKFAPLDALAQEEPQGPDHISHRQAWPSPFRRFSFKSFDDFSNQTACRYSQCSLPYGPPTIYGGASLGFVQLLD
jgi:hypothetical protein